MFNKIIIDFELSIICTILVCSLPSILKLSTLYKAKIEKGLQVWRWEEDVLS